MVRNVNWIPTNIELGDGLVITAVLLTPLTNSRASEKGRFTHAVSFVFNRRMRSRGWKVWVPSDPTKAAMLLPPQIGRKEGDRWNNFIINTLPAPDRDLILSHIRMLLHAQQEQAQEQAS